MYTSEWNFNKLQEQLSDTQKGPNDYSCIMLSIYTLQNNYALSKMLKEGLQRLITNYKLNLQQIRKLQSFQQFERTLTK